MMMTMIKDVTDEDHDHEDHDEEGERYIKATENELADVADRDIQIALYIFHHLHDDDDDHHHHHHHHCDNDDDMYDVAGLDIQIALYIFDHLHHDNDDGDYDEASAITIPLTHLLMLCKGKFTVAIYMTLFLPKVQITMKEMI